MRVVVADDSFLAREALLRVLEGAEGIEVVAACPDLTTLKLAVEETQPDVVVTDIRMPPMLTDEGLRASAAFRVSYPKMGVVILSQYAEPRFGLAVLDGGSDGRAYLLKERIQYRGQLVSAIQSVAHGGSMMDSKVVETLLTARTQAEDSPLNELTPRELEILALIARGLSNQAIADELVLTKRAVEKHINSVFLKLGLTDGMNVARRVKATLVYLAEDGQ